MRSAAYGETVVAQNEPTYPKPEMTPGTQPTGIKPEGGSEFEPAKPSIAPTPATKPEKTTTTQPEVVPPKKPGGEPELTPPRKLKAPGAMPDKEWTPAPSPQIEVGPDEIEPNSPDRDPAVG